MSKNREYDNPVLTKDALEKLFSKPKPLKQKNSGKEVLEKPEIKIKKFERILNSIIKNKNKISIPNIKRGIERCKGLLISIEGSNKYVNVYFVRKKIESVSKRLSNDEYKTKSEIFKNIENIRIRFIKVRKKQDLLELEIANPVSLPKERLSIKIVPTILTFNSPVSSPILNKYAKHITSFSFQIHLKYIIAYNIKGNVDYEIKIFIKKVNKKNPFNYIIINEVTFLEKGRKGILIVKEEEHRNYLTLIEKVKEYSFLLK